MPGKYGGRTDKTMWLGRTGSKAQVRKFTRRHRLAKRIVVAKPSV